MLAIDMKGGKLSQVLSDARISRLATQSGLVDSRNVYIHHQYAQFEHDLQRAHAHKTQAQRTAAFDAIRLAYIQKKSDLSETIATLQIRHEANIAKAYNSVWSSTKEGRTYIARTNHMVMVSAMLTAAVCLVSRHPILDIGCPLVSIAWVIQRSFFSRRKDKNSFLDAHQVVKITKQINGQIDECQFQQAVANKLMDIFSHELTLSSTKTGCRLILLTNTANKEPRPEPKSPLIVHRVDNIRYPSFPQS